MTNVLFRASLSVLALALGLSFSCGGPEAPQEAAQEAGGGAASSGDGYLLDGPMPPDPCEVLTEARAAEILGGEAAQRGSGGACAYQRGTGDEAAFVRLLWTAFPLEQLDSSRQDREAVAQTLGAMAQRPTPPGFYKEIAGVAAFADEADGVSVLWLASGVNTTAMTSERPVGEVAITLSLQDGRPHEERLATLEGLAADAVDALRAQTGGA